MFILRVLFSFRILQSAVWQSTIINPKTANLNEKQKNANCNYSCGISIIISNYSSRWQSYYHYFKVINQNLSSFFRYVFGIDFTRIRWLKCTAKSIFFPPIWLNGKMQNLKFHDFSVRETSRNRKQGLTQCLKLLLIHNYIYSYVIR